MAKKKIIKPSQRRLIFNKKHEKFISFEEEMALQELEQQKQNEAKSRALAPDLILAPEDDEPSLD